MSSAPICNNCGAQSMSVFYELKYVPVNSCLIMPTRQEALNVPKGEIALAFCEQCGFISNIAFDPSSVDYSPTYEDQQCFSPTFNAFARALADRLIKKYNLYNKDIVEIGCGKGDFLMLLCEMGHNRGVGIDPACSSDRLQGSAKERITLIQDYYSPEYASYRGDLVCCRHTLEHIYNTAEFMDTVRCNIGDARDTVVFFEVPDVTRILRELAFWDINYEHCSYFSPGSLARLFRSYNFEIIDLFRDFNDQYLLIEAKPVSEPSNKINEIEESPQRMLEDIQYFSVHCEQMLNQWKQKLQAYMSENQRVCIWGSGSKCVSFMATLGIEDEVECVVDINPYRHGKFMPGIGKEIVPPEFLKISRPDVIIVMNPNYRDEIRQMAEDMGIRSEVISI